MTSSTDELERRYPPPKPLRLAPVRRLVALLCSCTRSLRRSRRTLRPTRSQARARSHQQSIPRAPRVSAVLEVPTQTCQHRMRESGGDSPVVELCCRGLHPPSSERRPRISLLGRRCVSEGSRCQLPARHPLTSRSAARDSSHLAPASASSADVPYALSRPTFVSLPEPAAWPASPLAPSGLQGKRPGSDVAPDAALCETQTTS